MFYPIDVLSNRCFWQSIFSTIDVLGLKVDVLEVDVLKVDVLVVVQMGRPGIIYIKCSKVDWAITELLKTMKPQFKKLLNTFFQTSTFLFVRRRGHVGVDGRDEGLDRRLEAKLHRDLPAQHHLLDTGRVRSLSHRLRLPGNILSC